MSPTRIAAGSAAVGLALLVVGCALVSVALALIVAGAVLLGFGLVLDVPQRKKRLP